MKIVIDANPIISILIKPGKPIELFFLEEIEFYCPELLFVEIENNKEEIYAKSGLPEYEIDKLVEILKRKIKIISEKDFITHRQKAGVICPDPKDIVYFALALHLKCPIWSNEKNLKKQEYIGVYSTHELIEKFKL